MSRNQFATSVSVLRSRSLFVPATLRRAALGGLCALLLMGHAVATQAASLTWSPGAGGGTWDTATMNWNSFTTLYNDPNADDVTFNNTAGGTVTVQGGGVTPLGIAVSAASGTYTFAGGSIGGAGGLTKSGGGTLAIGSNYTGLTYTGLTQVNGGILQIAHNSGGGDPSNRSLGGTLELNGGTLRFQHTGAGSSNPTLTFSSLIQVTGLGGTINFNGASNAFTNTIGPVTLGGDLGVTGNTGNPNGFGASYNFTGGSLTLSTNAAITNNTTTAVNGPHAILLSTTMTGATRTLTLNKAGTGGGFQIGAASDYTAKSINLQNLVSNADLNVPSTTGGADPFDTLQANGGGLTMGTGTTLSMMGGINSGSPQLIDPTAMTFSGNNTLFIYRAQGGNRDSYARITDNLNVGGGSGLVNLHYEAIRGTLTVDAGKTLTVGTGGSLTVTVANTINGFLNGNANLSNGSTLQGNISGTFLGGFVRGTTGTLTLGNGSGTLANPNIVTIQGNSAGTVKTFNVGWAANTTENGIVRAKYSNSNAANLFNVGWSNGGSPTAAVTGLKETSGGTEFAPLVGAGGVAVVGPTAGTVSTFNNPVSLTTAGIVGFYNRANTNNDRGSIGDVLFLNDLSGIGTIQAANVNFNGGSITPGLSAGTLTVNGNLVLSSTTELNFELTTPGIVGSGVNDLIAVTGSLTLDGTLTLPLLPSDGTYTLFTYTGSLTNNGLILPEYTTLDTSMPGVVLLTYLTPVPEPTTCGLIGFGLLLLRRRKRGQRA